MKLIRIGVGPHPSPQQRRSAFPKSCSVVWLGFVQWWWLGDKQKGRLHAHGMFKTDSLEAKAGIRRLAGWSVSSTVLCLLWTPPQLSSVPLLMSPCVSALLKCIFWTLKKWACSSSLDANGCDQPKPTRGLTHCLDGISKACTPCAQVRKGLKISFCLGSNWSVFNISSISIFIEEFSMHSSKCLQFPSH